MEVGLVGAVVEPRVDLERHDAVFLDGLGDVVRRTALGEVQFAVHPDVFFGLFHEGVADDPHLREVDRSAACAQDFTLQKRKGREAPACAAAVLVLDGCHLQHLGVGEAVALGLGLFGCRLGDGAAQSADGQQGKQKVFHLSLGLK